MKIIVLAFLFLLIFLPRAFARPSWAVASAYVAYDQLFSWSGGSETTRMAWNITGVSDSLADLRVTSYSYNVTNGQVNIFPVEDLWKVNLETREITEAAMGVAGLKNPFWIESGVSVGSTVDAYFGTMATIQPPETAHVLGEDVSCWKVDVGVGPSSTMQRWYDPATGIVLRIDTTLLRGGISMNVRETAVSSNIAMIGTGSTGAWWLTAWPYNAGWALLAVGLVTATFYFYRRSRRHVAS